MHRRLSVIQSCESAREIDFLQTRRLAVHIGDSDIVAVRKCLEDGVNIGAEVVIDGRGALSPLFRCVVQGEVEIARLLLDRGVGVEWLNSSGLSALHWAASGSMVEMCALLLERGASLEMQDPNGATALHYAARDEDFAGFRFLLEKGARLWVRDKMGRNALHHAAEADRADNCRELIRMGFSIDDVAELSGEGAVSLLQAAVRRDAFSVVRMLVQEYGQPLEHDAGKLVLLKKARSGQMRECLLSLQSEQEIGQAASVPQGAGVRRFQPGVVL
jgi:ankyrin repeat protein